MTTSIKNYSVPISIVLAGIFIALAIYFGGSAPDIKPANNNFNQPSAVNIKNVKVENSPFIGNPNAPITIAYWFDYQCPACKYNEENLMIPLVENYVKTGKVKIVFKDFPFLGLNKKPLPIMDSINLAVTARAVWEAFPDKYYEWHKTIFAKQGQENSGWATPEVIENITKAVFGPDSAIISKLVSDKGEIYKTQISADKAEGASFGVDATPSFIVDTELIRGAPAYKQLANYIDSLIQ